MFSAFLLMLGLAPAFAEPITADGIHHLPAKEQPAWQSYLKRSQAAARADQAALDAEVTANGMTSALKAPMAEISNCPTRLGTVGMREKRPSGWPTLFSYQTPSGGWSKHISYREGRRKPGMQWTLQSEPGQPAHYLATFDNRSTTEQLYFLAYVGKATGRKDCPAAFGKGLDFILAAQNPNGGWPQT